MAQCRWRSRRRRSPWSKRKLRQKSSPSPQSLAPSAVRVGQLGDHRGQVFICGEFAVIARDYDGARIDIEHRQAVPRLQWIEEELIAEGSRFSKGVKFLTL